MVPHCLFLLLPLGIPACSGIDLTLPTIVRCRACKVQQGDASPGIKESPNLPLLPQHNLADTIGGITRFLQRTVFRLMLKSIVGIDAIISTWILVVTITV